MSVQGWNPSYGHGHGHGHGHEQSRPTATLLACRICDKICLNTHSLIQHYESHQDELARVRQHHDRLNFASIHRRYHPYLSNGFGALQQQQVYARPNPVSVPIKPPRHSPPLRTQTVKVSEQTETRKTVWYLGQLDRPIPRIMNPDHRHYELCNLDLTLKI